MIGYLWLQISLRICLQTNAPGLLLENTRKCESRSSLAKRQRLVATGWLVSVLFDVIVEVMFDFKFLL